VRTDGWRDGLEKQEFDSLSIICSLLNRRFCTPCSFNRSLSRISVFVSSLQHFDTSASYWSRGAPLTVAFIGESGRKRSTATPQKMVRPGPVST
jgi:hypothetical protein